MPIRTCIGCHRTDEQDRLVRLVADAAGRVRIDARRRLPGRGAYVHVAEECVEELVRKQALARSLKRKTSGIELAGLWAQIRQLSSE